MWVAALRRNKPAPATRAGSSIRWRTTETLENDRDPWIEFDLDGVFKISQVVIENRDDCCAERAVPMAIEVSLGNGAWQQVAQRSKPFSEWRANFPGVQASRVRLHLQQRGTLHLKRVSIYR